jgi:hypothetical protein
MSHFAVEKPAVRLDRPIFIVGSGRCGSTILHKIFSLHPQVAFLSGLCSRYPRQPGFNRRAMQLLDVPLLGHLTRRHFRPAEHWAYWNEYCRVFSRPCRDLSKNDVSPLWRSQIRRALEQLVTRRRNRLLVKLSGWPRMGFLSEIFADAIFIHIVRDGRAVAHSLMNVDFWRGHRGPAQWRWGSLTTTQQVDWERSGRSFWTLAGIQWNILMDAFELARAPLPSNRYLEIRYEDFTADPVAVFRDVIAFCDLNWSARFEAAVNSLEIENANFKWRDELTPLQQHQLEDVMADRLGRWGYPLSGAGHETTNRLGLSVPETGLACSGQTGSRDAVSDTEATSELPLSNSAASSG